VPSAETAPEYVAKGPDRMVRALYRVCCKREGEMRKREFIDILFTGMIIHDNCVKIVSHP